MAKETISNKRVGNKIPNILSEKDSTFKDYTVTGQIYNPNSRENKLRSIQSEMERVATRISYQHEYLDRLRRYANILLGKNIGDTQKHKIRIESHDPDIESYEIILEYSIPQFVPKDAKLMIKANNSLVWNSVSRVQFFKLIRSCKDAIRNLDREYGRLTKYYNEVKENKEDRKADLLEMKKLKLKEIELIDKELETIN